MNMNLAYLPSATRDILQELAEEKFMERFTLVGGSALALQLEHRQSEDLDFIQDGKNLDDRAILRFIDSKFENDYRLLKEERGSQLDFVIRGIKVTFFVAGTIMIHFGVQDYAKRYGKLYIAEARIIGVLKMAAIGQRNTIRDYYDLYYLSRYHVPLAETVALTRRLVPTLAPITYTETIIYVDDLEEDSISSHLEPKEQVTKEEMAAFFTEEVRKNHG